MKTLVTFIVGLALSIALPLQLFALTDNEYTSFLKNPIFAKADADLQSAWNNYYKSLPPNEKKEALSIQRQWIQGGRDGVVDELLAFPEQPSWATIDPNWTEPEYKMNRFYSTILEIPPKIIGSMGKIEKVLAYALVTDEKAKILHILGTQNTDSSYRVQLTGKIFHSYAPPGYCAIFQPDGWASYFYLYWFGGPEQWGEEYKKRVTELIDNGNQVIITGRLVDLWNFDEAKLEVTPINTP